MLGDICTREISSDLLLITVLAGVITTFIIGLSFMIGKVLSNPKVILWSKTEIIQLVVSIASVLILLQIINQFCIIDMNSMYAITDIDPSASLGDDLNLYEGAQGYLIGAAEYTHVSLAIQRYHLEAYNMLQLRSRWDCIFGFIMCFFGSAGTSNAPHAWASYFSTAFNISFNSSLFAYMSTINFLFILEFVKSGMALFLIPFGIFLRAMPYMRSLGSLLIAVALSFMIVYPTVLAVFGLIGPVLFTYENPEILVYTDEGHIDAVNVFGASWDWGTDDYDGKMFNHGRMETLALGLAGKAFIIGVFIPLLALIAAIASVSYFARILGEEIDLSRLIQMV